MALFQSAVLNKYLKEQDSDRIAAAYALFTAHFHDPAIQANIRDSKEEQYQEGFLRDLFVQVLGYTLNPQKGFDLTTEFKNEKGAKKADGAILVDGTALAVIELKGTDTTDLTTINAQAFNYKANHSHCVYVVTSNFQKLRFFIDNAVDHIEFDLFTLNAADFRLLWLCLQRDNLLGGIPKKVKAESLQEEEKVTKRLYADYSTFKNALWQDLCTQHPEHDKLLLYKKSQKLLDRFLFVLFSEDKGLLPPNSIRAITTQWEQLRELDAYVPLYDRFLKYFGYLNTGHKGAHHDIFAYNGGLFKPDELLDNVRISDDVLHPHVLRLSKYDFASEVDVNILGHIFEHSLNEIENITAQLEGRAVDGKKTKRKKDGVFYTPKYITQYIVEHTVGRLCTEKKDELAIVDEDYAKGRKGRQRKTIEALDTKLDVYRDWLLGLSICDPACGSGAFLNQALDFLIAEHRYVDELQASLLGHSITFKDIGDHILERNIYGVDINEESVEIARLSLWLRTATKGRKLNDLSSKIKCGNSLIDDPAVAGAKAFDWKKEFPDVFAKGGFDVVIGNPPYVFGGNEGISNAEKQHYKETYETGGGKVNLFTLFIEASYRAMAEGAAFAFIIPNTFLRVTSYHESRKFFIDNFEFIELADLGAGIFQDAVTTAIILVARKRTPKPSDVIKVIQDFSGQSHLLARKDILVNDYVITSNVSGEELAILHKMSASSVQLGEECEELIFGVVITKNKDEVVSETPVDGYKPFLEGRDIGPYLIRPVHQWLNYTASLLHRARTPKVFEAPEKLLIQRITGGSRPIKAAYDNKQYYNKESINNIILNRDSQFSVKYVLALLNSSLINWYYNSQFTNESTLTVNISKEYLSKIPIKMISDQAELIGMADRMLRMTSDLYSVEERLVSLLRSKYSLPDLSRKLEHWPTLEFKEFLKELQKAKVTLSLSEEAEWLGYFSEQQAKAHALQAEIDRTDKEIDALVYRLYGLTEEEVKVVEGKN